MEREPSSERLAEQWTLDATDWEWLANKSGATRLGFAALLKFFAAEGRFPRERDEVPAAVIEFLAGQVRVPAAAWLEYRWEGRTFEYHRAQVRGALGYREPAAADAEVLAGWLRAHWLARERNPDRLKEAATARCRELRIEPPAPDRMDRIVHSAAAGFEEQFCRELMGNLPERARQGLEGLLLAAAPDAGRVALHALRADPGPASIETVEEELGKLNRLRGLQLPARLFSSLAPAIVEAYRRRAAVEEVHELRRHPAPLRLTLLAAFCHLRIRELVDTLCDLLIGMVHKVAHRAEVRVERELIADFKRVSGKNNLLFAIAEASLARPEAPVRAVVYPIANEQMLGDLVREFKATGPAYRQQLHAVMRTAYRSHYRAMLIRLLETLEFRSGNDLHKPVLEALALVRKYAGSRVHAYPPETPVPVAAIVRGPWQETVLERDERGNTRVNRLAYEVCVLLAVHERLRSKELWVEGADRYRNPDEDLPQDFADGRDAYYEALKLPREADLFVNRLKAELADALAGFDRGLGKSEYVRILKKDGGWISLSPLPAQTEPANLLALKARLIERWPMTSLLDVFKEADLRAGLTGVFRSATAWENLDRDLIQERLLLTLYGLGTNAGIKRMSAGQGRTTYKDLLYVRRRYITKDQLRAAIRVLVDAIFRERSPLIWGEGTTACASDSKKFGAWDQNLITEWHARYGGRGVMIYWHVDRKSTCIYSQLKSCSSSEAAAMIEGVLRHASAIEVEQQYVDSHGQSEVAFAFCRLLGFDLLPRLKNIHSQRLYRPAVSSAYPRLAPVLTRPIDWELIAQQYDPMVHYTTALRLGTAAAEDILRRFTRANVQHPVYRALAELGKTVKTIFLCRYLGSLQLRREIHEGLNVIESWNAANDFIFFGKGGEMASNRADDQEISMLALHLLQLSLVYVNTLMIQQVLAEPAWAGRLNTDDRRGITPLLYAHVNPYGSFRLDLHSRLPIDPPRFSPQSAGPQLLLDLGSQAG